jgi:SnoaL-like domain
VDGPIFMVWTFRDASAVRQQWFAEKSEALEAAGLREQAMLQDNVEILGGGFDAFNRGDYESWLTAFSGDVEVHDLADTPDTGVFHGHAGVRAWLAKLQEAFGGGFRVRARVVLGKARGSRRRRASERHWARGWRPDRNERVHRLPYAGRQDRLDTGVLGPRRGPRSSGGADARVRGSEEAAGD